MLNLKDFENSLLALENSIHVLENREKSKEVFENEIETLKSGIIQNFEISYELSWKIIKRYLSYNIGNENINALTKKELFRVACQNELITDVEKWFDFHKARNSTSHEYNINKVDEVYKYAVEFLEYGKELLMRIVSKND